MRSVTYRSIVGALPVFARVAVIGRDVPTRTGGRSVAATLAAPDAAYAGTEVAAMTTGETHTVCRTVRRRRRRAHQL